MTSPVLGIDLGTTNSVVAVADEEAIHVLAAPDGHQLLPSVVSFHPNGDVLVGRTARDRRLLDARNTIYSVKRLIGRPFDSEEVRRAKERFAFELTRSATGGVLLEARGEKYTLSEISAFVLREVRSIAERAIGSPCPKAVITVPANFNELQRSATKAAGRVAGLDVLRILNEPTAAALAYGYGRGSRERIAIFDLGGGTFDVTLLELAGEVFEVLATAGDTYLGGDDIDALIAEQMAEAFLAHHRYDPRQDRQAFERLRAAAEWSKCQLSTEQEVQLRVEELAYGDGGISLDLTFGLTRQGLEAMAMPLLSRAFDVCEDAMQVAGIRPTQLDNIILVGGSTRMPLVHSMVEEYFGRKPLAHVDPDLVVAQGAAIQARALATSRAKSRIGRVALQKVARRPHAGAREERIKIHDPRAVPPPPPPPSMDDVTRTSLDSFEEDEPTHARHPSGQPPPPPPPILPMTMPKPSAQNPGLPPPLEPSVMMAIGDPSETLESFDSDPFDLPPQPSGMPAPELAPPPLDFAPDFQPPQHSAPQPDSAALADPLMDAGFEPMAPVAPVAPVAPMAPIAPPLLLDVTPLSLGVETVGGYCEHIIKRNSAIPTEQHRLFSTGQDDQTEVVVRICQGESRRLEENQLLGEVVLSGLPPAARGLVPIEVSFLLDANGTLGVCAVDKRSGQQQTIRINLIGGVEDENLDAMQQRIEQKYAGGE